MPRPQVELVLVLTLLAAFPCGQEDAPSATTDEEAEHAQVRATDRSLKRTWHHFGRRRIAGERQQQPGGLHVAMLRRRDERVYHLRGCSQTPRTHDVLHSWSSSVEPDANFR